VPRRPARTRDSVRTRQAILVSARRAFARSGYDGAGVREIASGAGVTAMLVNRYFGSKEKLFAEVVEQAMTTPSVLTEEFIGSPAPARSIARALVAQTKAGDTPLDGFLIMLHSASSKRAARIGRAQIERHHHRSLTAAVRGARAPERAALVLSLVVGFQVMRQMFRLEALADADPDVLVSLLQPLLEQLIAGGRASD